MTTLKFLRFKMYCKTCGQDLEFDPDYNNDEIIIPAGEEVDGHMVFKLDLSWHSCGCLLDDVEPADWVVELVE